jgi:hypothetical protein
MSKLIREDYTLHFDAAVKRSYSFFSLSKPKLDLSKLDEIDQLRLADILERFLIKEGYPSLSVGAAQCLKWSYFLAGVTEEVLSMKCWVTLGQLWDGDRPMYNPSVDEVKKWRLKGIPLKDEEGVRLTMNLHAWITMEDGNIIDPTLLSSLALVIGGKWEKYNGMLQIGYQGELFLHHRYVPLLVGAKVAEDMDRNSDFPVIALHKQELYPLRIIGF